MLIFLYGNDSFRSREKVTEIKNKFLSHSSGAVSSVLDYGEKTVSSFASSIGETGLFSSKQLLLAERSIEQGAKEQQKSILETLKSRPELETHADIVIVFWEPNEPPKNNALYKHLAAKAKKQSFAPLEGNHLSRWTAQRLKSISPATEFSDDALNLLLSCVGSDLHLLSNELAKLSSLRPDGIVSAEDVKSMTICHATSTVFDTIEAMFSGNKKLALKLFHEQLSLGGDPFYLLSMYAYQTRNLLKVGDFFWNGERNHYTIAKAAGLHPFVVQKALSQLRNISSESLKAAHIALADIDRRAKTGQTDLVLALDTFIASL